MPNQESHFTDQDRAMIVGLNTQIVRLTTQMERAISDIARINEKYEKREDSFMTKDLAESFVTQDQFIPIKKIVYGAVTVVLVAVFSGMVYLVLRPGHTSGYTPQAAASVTYTHRTFYKPIV